MDLSEDYYNKLSSKVFVKQDLQKIRVGIGNRLNAYYRKYESKVKLEPDEKELLETLKDVGLKTEGIIRKEKKLTKEIEELAVEHPLWLNWLRNVKGIGPETCGFLIANFWNREFPSRSAMKIFCGLGTDKRGGPQKRKKGNSCNYRPELQAKLIGEKGIADHFILNKVEPYYSYYLKWKEEDAKKHPEYVPPEGGWSKLPKEKRHPGRLHKRALRKVAILFLSHLWEVIYWLKYSKEVIPYPMHFKNTPLSPEEYIAPPGIKVKLLEEGVIFL